LPSRYSAIPPRTSASAQRTCGRSWPAGGQRSRGVVGALAGPREEPPIWRQSWSVGIDRTRRARTVCYHRRAGAQRRCGTGGWLASPHGQVRRFVHDWGGHADSDRAP
jgi:hypothetical protein